MSFVEYSSLEKHLDWGKHKYALEQETLCDKAMTMHATKLERGPGVLPEIVDDGASISVEVDGYRATNRMCSYAPVKIWSNN